MTPQKALIELKLRLNKLASNDYDNIPDWVAISVINKAQIEWVRNQIGGNNKTQEGDEETKRRVDDLQNLLVEESIKGKNKDLYFETDLLPVSYLASKRIMPKANKSNCLGLVLKSNPVEESNVPTYLGDWSMQPSFEFAETFHTMIGNKIRVYTNGDFKIDDVKIMYYRRPREIDIAGYKHEDGSQSKDSSLEFKDDICRLILDEAASIAASDIESANAAVINKQRADTNN